jgi:hypothetical protein
MTTGAFLSLLNLSNLLDRMIAMARQHQVLSTPHSRAKLGFYSYAFACEVFSCVSVAVFLPILLERERLRGAGGRLDMLKDPTLSQNLLGRTVTLMETHRDHVSKLMATARQGAALSKSAGLGSIPLPSGGRPPLIMLPQCKSAHSRIPTQSLHQISLCSCSSRVRHLYQRAG